MDSFEYVIVGGGPAALNAIRAIRDTDPKGSLLWISNEPHLPYSKVLLTYVLSGKIEESKISLIDPQQLGELNVKFWPKKTAVSLKTTGNTLGFDNGQEVTYERLLIASGASPYFPKIPGIESSGVFGLRTLDDIRNINSLVSKNSRVVILGGGLVGTQVANAFFLRGIASSLVVSSPNLLNQVLDHEAVSFLQKQIENRGPNIYFNESVEDIQSKRGQVSSVLLKSGKEIRADIVIIGKGIKPNVAFLEGSGVNVEWGIPVDRRMSTNIRNVYAAGDVALSHDLISGEKIYAATWAKAINEGWIAGKNMAGGDLSYEGNLKMNISTIFNITIAVVGDIREKTSDTELFSNKETYRKIFTKNDRIVGIILIGCYEDVGVMANLIRSRASFSSFYKKYKGEPLNFNQIYEEFYSQQ